MADTDIRELERRLIQSADPAEHARVVQELRDGGYPHLADEVDRIAQEAQ